MDKIPPTIDELILKAIQFSEDVNLFLSLPGTNTGEKSAISRSMNTILSQLEKIRSR